MERPSIAVIVFLAALWIGWLIQLGGTAAMQKYADDLGTPVPLQTGTTVPLQIHTTANSLPLQSRHDKGVLWWPLWFQFSIATGFTASALSGKQWLGAVAWVAAVCAVVQMVLLDQHLVAAVEGPDNPLTEKVWAALFGAAMGCTVDIALFAYIGIQKEEASPGAAAPALPKFIVLGLLVVSWIVYLAGAAAFRAQVGDHFNVPTSSADELASLSVTWPPKSLNRVLFWPVALQFAVVVLYGVSSKITSLAAVVPGVLVVSCCAMMYAASYALDLLGGDGDLIDSLKPTFFYPPAPNCGMDNWLPEKNQLRCWIAGCIMSLVSSFAALLLYGGVLTLKDAASSSSAPIWQGKYATLGLLAMVAAGWVVMLGGIAAYQDELQLKKEQWDGSQPLCETFAGRSMSTAALERKLWWPLVLQFLVVCSLAPLAFGKIGARWMFLSLAAMSTAYLMTTASDSIEHVMNLRMGRVSYNWNFSCFNTILAGCIISMLASLSAIIAQGSEGTGAQDSDKAYELQEPLQGGSLEAPAYQAPDNSL